MVKQITAIAFVAALGFAAQASAASYHHIDELAITLQRQTAQLYREFHHHYRHTSEYPHLRCDALEMYRLARHVHEVAHDHGSLSHLESDLKQLDRLFHHIEDLVRDIEHEAIHHNGHRHFGHVHGHTRHLRRLLNDTEDTLHHLQHDIRKMLVHERHHHHGHRHVELGNEGITFRLPGFSFRLSR